MARSPVKVATENDVTPAAEETLDFDDDTLRGEMKLDTCYSENVDTVERS